MPYTATYELFVQACRKHSSPRIGLGRKRGREFHVCVYIAEGQVGGNRMKEGKGAQSRGDSLSKEKYNF